MATQQRGVGRRAAIAWTATSAVALLSLGAAYGLGRHDRPGAYLLFWLGAAAIVLPSAALAGRREATPAQRLSLVCWTAAALYFAKVLHTHTLFTFHDEFAHWRSTWNILATGGISGANPLNPPSARFPGLHLATAQLSAISGLSIFGSGLIVVGLAKVLLVGALCLAAGEVVGSPRAGAIAAFIYMANPNFVFWGSQFAYESFALPLAALAGLFAVRAVRSSEGRTAWIVAASVTGAAVAISHHLTSYALVLALAGGIGLVHGRARRLALLIPTVVTAITASAWTMFVAPEVSGYIGPPLKRGFNDFYGFVQGEQSRRVLLSAAQESPPFWERGVAFGAVGVLLLAGASAAVYILLRRRRSVPLTALALVTLAYPLTLALRLTDGGQEISNRTSEFVFVPLAVVVATALLAFKPGRRWPALRSLPVLLALSVVSAGGIVVGFAHYARLPGSYLISGGPRSIDAQWLAATDWLRDTAGPGHRVATTATGALLTGSYGLQLPAMAISGHNASPLFFASTMGPEQWGFVDEAAIEYIAVDLRITRGLPLDPYFVDRGEPDGGAHTAPLPASYLSKFDAASGLRRIYDSGDIRIYEVIR